MYILFEYLYAFVVLVFKRNVKLTFFSRIGKNCQFEGYNKIGRNCIFQNSSLGLYSYCGNNCVFTNTIIGRFCSIASNVEIITGTHPSRIWVSTHPAFFSRITPYGNGFVENDRFQQHKYTRSGLSVKIGNDVWIGAHVKILEGVTIGDGSIIAAGSIVTKDVGNYEVVGGNPAKKIRTRFETNEIALLMENKWWDWNIDDIRKKALKFDNIVNLFDTYDK